MLLVWGCGLVFTVDPVTGEVTGQISLTTTNNDTGTSDGLTGGGVGGAGGLADSAAGGGFTDAAGGGVSGVGCSTAVPGGAGLSPVGAGVGSPAPTAVSAAGSQDDDRDAGCVAGWSQARVDAVFYALVGDLAGAPQEIIDPHTGRVEGRVIQSLYGQRSWAGSVSSPLLFAGQFVDAESGWAYNRFRFYSPVLAGFNAQDPLGLAPRIASAQGYVDHAAYWVDVLGLVGKQAHTKLSRKDTSRIDFIHNRVNGHKEAVLADWNRGSITYSENQLSHVRQEHWPKQMHRGTVLDQELKKRIDNDQILQNLDVQTSAQGKAGADMTFPLPDSNQTMWMDLTTEKSWSAHYRRYGPVFGVREAMHKVTYRDGGYSGYADIRGKVM